MIVCIRFHRKSCRNFGYQLNINSIVGHVKIICHVYDPHLLEMENVTLKLIISFLPKESRILDEKNSDNS